MKHSRPRHAVHIVLLAGLGVPVWAGCSHLADCHNAGIAVLDEAPAPVGPFSRGAKYAGWALSAPLVAAAVPVAAAAWATPWVDLPLAVDIASAPAIGLGYATQAALGFPLHGILSLAGWPRKAPRPPEGPPPDASLVPWGFVVDHRPCAGQPRASLPLPREIEAYYETPPGAVEQLEKEIARRLTGEEEAIRIPLSSGSPSELQLHLARRSPEARPLVLMTPPLRAAFAATYLARRFARRGVHAAVIVPGGDFLEKDLTPAAVEARFREAVVNARTALRALAGLEAVDRDRLLYLGVSAGGIFGAVLLAVEPSIRRAALMLPGGDLPRIIGESEEGTVVAYREAWRARGVEPAALTAELAREVRTDPQLLARYVDPRRLLIFLGASDTQVPVATGLSLREALGEPETYLLAGNHDTAMLCFGFVLRRVEEFLLARG